MLQITPGAISTAFIKYGRNIQLDVANHGLQYSSLILACFCFLRMFDSFDLSNSAASHAGSHTAKRSIKHGC